ncbi:MAG: hypothetical protein ACI90V_003326 [Bacillariaceae sp.]|jgi:hypothetical protein
MEFRYKVYNNSSEQRYLSIYQCDCDRQIYNQSKAARTSPPKAGDIHPKLNSIGELLEGKT